MKPLKEKISITIDSDILEKAKKKHPVGEMEAKKIGKSGFISTLVVGILAVAFMIVFGALHNFTALYIIGFLCFTWAAVFYFLQFFIAKRPYGVLIGAILESIGSAAMFVFFILYQTGVLG